MKKSIFLSCDMSQRQWKYVDFYCRDNNRELKKIVDPIIKGRFGWIEQKDYDDFYSLSEMVLLECEIRFDEEKNESFKSYLIGSIERKIRSRITYMNQKKRMVTKEEDGKTVYIHPISIDTYISEDENIKLVDTLVSDFDLEKEVFGEYYSEKTLNYLERLSKLERKVLDLISFGFCSYEIKKILNISDSQYNECRMAIFSERNLCLLY